MSEEGESEDFQGEGAEDEVEGEDDADPEVRGWVQPQIYCAWFYKRGVETPARPREGNCRDLRADLVLID